MKTFRMIGLSLMIALVGTSYIACNDADKVLPYDSSFLIGTWVEETNNVEEVLYIQFDSDFSGYQWTTNNDKINELGKQYFRWEATDKIITVSINNSLKTLNYSVSGGKLTISSGSETITYIKK